MQEQDSKKCRTCEKVKPLNEFHQRHDGKISRPIGECKLCRGARSKKRHSENVVRHRELVKRRYDTFGRFDRYGITAEQYAKVLADQGGKCGLCGTFAPGGKGVWHIDHVHDYDAEASGEWSGFKKGTADQFRGLLCHKCNMGLGFYEAIIRRVGVEKIRIYLQGVSPLK